MNQFIIKMNSQPFIHSHVQEKTHEIQERAKGENLLQ